MIESFTEVSDHDRIAGPAPVVGTQEEIFAQLLESLQEKDALVEDLAAATEAEEPPSDPHELYQYYRRLGRRVMNGESSARPFETLAGVADEQAAEPEEEPAALRSAFAPTAEPMPAIPAPSFEFDPVVDLVVAREVADGTAELALGEPLEVPAESGPSEPEIEPLRIEDDGVGDSGPPGAPAGGGADPLAVVESGTTGFEELFETLRARLRGSHKPTLVLAGAAATDRPDRIARNLSALASSRGKRVLVAEFSEDGGQTVLRRVRGSQDRHPGLAIQIDPTSHTVEERVASWRDEVAPEAEITLVVGPALADSADAALLAAACDGLVLVATTGGTPRAAIDTSGDRVALTGCATLGVVVDASDDPLPVWLRRILSRPGAAERVA